MMGAKFGDNSDPSSSHRSLGSKIIKWDYTYVLGDGHRIPKCKVKIDSLMSKRGRSLESILSCTPGAKVPKFQVREARSQRSPTGRGEHRAEGSQILPYSCFLYLHSAIRP